MLTELFKVVEVEDSEEFVKALNNPPDFYEVHSWDKTYWNGVMYTIVYKLRMPGSDTFAVPPAIHQT